MHVEALLHLYMHATACVHQRSKVTVWDLPPLTTFLIITHLPALNHPLLYAAHIPVAQDVSTRSVPGNDPFTMATTNKEKIPLVRGKASKGGHGQREREGELAGSQECQASRPPLHPDKRALTIRMKNKPAAGCCRRVGCHPSGALRQNAYRSVPLQINPCPSAARERTLEGDNTSEKSL